MSQLTRVDEYLHTVPLSGATGQQIGPFTLFRSTTVWPYYARPVPGSGATIEPADVERVRERCQELDLPLNFEWVVETCPSLGPAAAAAGLQVTEYPLLVLEREDFKRVITAARCEILPADEDLLRQARAVAAVGFGDPGTEIGSGGPAERDAQLGDVSAEMAQALLDRANAGVSVTAAAFGDDGMLASGVHQPVGSVTEVVGVATLPSARRQGLGAAVTSCLVEHALANGVELILLSAQNDAVAAVYERVGFHRIGHAGAAE
ncbi:GCN5-related N-acetyltransferase [Kribbella flavida DSM 17836]|uniref:GCN5-related N-acetyltransferase n=1 Tax=Kribbella flavida (strain DSM 17836 / JCM 10339 / NBRC 14399) TaxID=479435 RepID=D2PRL9_KRIFD|nr:GNAT family N-acetyltransferase [Kribbella flavida]ADB34937.1 GCN5-related N-acetyltransferase [Kribbella flavida DSM 17836]